MNFRKYILQRIAFSVFALLGLSVLIFTIARVLPGDPARMALGPSAPDWAIQSFRNELHLNDPLPVQYAIWLRDIFSGSLGRSLMTRRDVTTDIVEFLPASLELIIFAAVVEVFFSITLGVLAGRRANTWVDNTIRVFSYLGVAVPSFVFGVIFLLTLGFIFPVFPRGGRLSTGLLAPGPVTGMLTIDSLLTGNLRVFADATWHLVLPGLALCLGGLAQDCRITRSSVVENMNKDYILSATSHGIPERIIMLKYLLKPSLIPAVSIMGLDIAGLLGNAFLVELIFGFPGFSRYGITAMMNKDLNAIVGTVMVIGLVFAVVNIAVDILVAYIDPRIRLTEKAK